MCKSRFRGLIWQVELPGVKLSLIFRAISSGDNKTVRLFLRFPCRIFSTLRNSDTRGTTTFDW